MKILLISTCVFIFTNFLYAQDYNIYQQDFIQLANLIQTSYPADDSIKSKMYKLKDEYVKKLDSCTSKDEFEIIGHMYLALLHDGHTSLKSYVSFTRDGRYPIKFKVVNNNIYISNYLQEIEDKYIGCKVVSINGVPIDTVAKRAIKFFSFDNEAGFYNEFEYWLKWVSFLNLCGIDINTKFSIGIEEKNCISNFIFERSFNPAIYRAQLGNKSIVLDIKKRKYHKYTKNKLSNWSGNLFEYKILKESNTCYFKYMECADLQYLNANKHVIPQIPDWILKIFWHFRGGDFSRFISKMFSEIEKKDIDNLIIDLRQNKGGTDMLGYQLMDYFSDIEHIKDYSESIMISELLKKNYSDYFNKLLADYKIDTNSVNLPILVFSQDKNEIYEYLRDKNSPYFQEKPIKKFKGHVFVLVGNETFSSAAMLAVLLKDNNIATIVGNPISTNPTHCGELLSFKLLNTGTRGTLSCKRFYRPILDKKTNKLQIDINVANSIFDTYNGIDTELDFLLDEINKQ